MYIMYLVSYVSYSHIYEYVMCVCALQTTCLISLTTMLMSKNSLYSIEIVFSIANQQTNLSYLGILGAQFGEERHAHFIKIFIFLFEFPLFLGTTIIIITPNKYYKYNKYNKITSARVLYVIYFNSYKLHNVRSRTTVAQW